jgi:hypothetical protein
MNRFKTYGLVGLCGVGVMATIDSAFGLGGSALIADICMTLLEGDTPEGEMDNGMTDMPMEIKPVPLIALSLVATTAAIVALSRDHQRMLKGKSEPDDAERATMLSAMLLVAAERGRTSREELKDVFRIVTSHRLSPELVEFVYDRFKQMSETELAQYRLAPLTSSIGRRRTLAAALMIGSGATTRHQIIEALLDRIASDIGATPEDIQAAIQSVENWQDGCEFAEGISPVTVLRHRELELTPA